MANTLFRTLSMTDQKTMELFINLRTAHATLVASNEFSTEQLNKHLESINTLAAFSADPSNQLAAANLLVELNALLDSLTLTKACR